MRLYIRMVQLSRQVLPTPLRVHMHFHYCRSVNFTSFPTGLERAVARLAQHIALSHASIAPTKKPTCHARKTSAHHHNNAQLHLRITSLQDACERAQTASLAYSHAFLFQGIVASCFNSTRAPFHSLLGKIQSDQQHQHTHDCPRIH